MSTARTASASRVASPGGTSRAASSPVSSGVPPTRVATMGTPARSASCRMSGWPSHTLGSTNTAAEASRAGTSSRWPGNRASSRSRAAWLFSSASSGPSPTMTRRGSGRISRQRGSGLEQGAEPLLGGQPADGEHGRGGPDRRGTARVSAETPGGTARLSSADGTASAGTRARPTRRAPAARIRSSRSGDTHSTESAVRATISSSTR